MPNFAIKAEGVGKKYILNHKQQASESFRELIVGSAKGVAKKLNPFFRGPTANFKEEFSALHDINFEIKQGDKVGIIGRNGAGKSTLLKVLSRITEPSAGKITINGRVASLLEVGTGFHPELTGRENIYLNGAILGMSRAEITKKFDEIVAFAEVDKFLDTPVKRYSSGMYVRLAFSVAAHLEPEILVIDEVLAVGDIAFQKKCLGKMGEVGREGRTVLFVSHNMNAIQQLCSSAILLESGSVRAYSQNVSEVIQGYYARDETRGGGVWHNSGTEYSNEYFKPISIRITDVLGLSLQLPISNDADCYLEVVAEVENINNLLTIGYCLYNQDDQPLYWSYQTDTDENSWPELKVGINKMRTKIPKRILNEGEYRIELIGGLHFVKWLFEPRKGNPELYFDIQGGLSDSPYMMHKRPTILSPVLEWEINNV